MVYLYEDSILTAGSAPKGFAMLRPATKGFMKKAFHLLLSRDDFIEAGPVGPKDLVEIGSYVDRGAIEWS